MRSSGSLRQITGCQNGLQTLISAYVGSFKCTLHKDKLDRQGDCWNAKAFRLGGSELPPCCYRGMTLMRDWPSQKRHAYINNGLPTQISFKVFIRWDQYCETGEWRSRVWHAANARKNFGNLPPPGCLGGPTITWEIAQYIGGYPYRNSQGYVYCGWYAATLETILTGMMCSPLPDAVLKVLAYRMYLIC